MARRIPRPGRRLAVATLVVAAIAIAAFARHRGGIAADHRDSMTLTNDAAADIADVYTFRSPSNPNDLVLAMTVSGLIPPSESDMTFFDPNVLHEFNIDTNGDAVEDLVIQVFATGTGPDQTIHVRGPAVPAMTGAVSMVLDRPDDAVVEFSSRDEVNVEQSGELTVFAGVRDDPFFFDLARFNEITAGMASGFRDPGVDTFAGTNALAIVVELPGSTLGSQLGVWGTTSRR